MFLMFQAVQEPHILDECELSEELKKVLLENIKQKLTQQAVKIRADIEVQDSVFGPVHLFVYETKTFAVINSFTVFPKNQARQN
jgi:hypothetical protein